MGLSIWDTHSHSLGRMSERGEALSMWEIILLFWVLPFVLILSLRKLQGLLLYGFPEENSLCLLSLVLCLCFIVVHVILSIKDPKIIMLA